MPFQVRQTPADPQLQTPSWLQASGRWSSAVQVQASPGAPVPMECPTLGLQCWDGPGQRSPSSPGVVCLTALWGL